LGYILDKTEALRLLKELAKRCPNMGEKSVALNESYPNDQESKGFQVIVGGLNKDNKTCLRKAVSQYDYVIKEDHDRMVIYDPKELVCPDCGKYFNSMSELKTHITALHYSKEYQQTEEPTGIM
jgi:hypothetical protein